MSTWLFNKRISIGFCVYRLTEIDQESQEGRMGENLDGIRRRIASGTSLGRLGEETSNSMERLSRTSSPVPWDSILQNLSAALPVILHTPAASERKEERSSSVPHVHSEHHLRPEGNPLGVRGSVVRGSLNSVMRRRPVSGTCSLQETSGNGVPVVPTDDGPIVGRIIRVRHEETEEKLNQSLSMICRPKSPKTSSSQADEVSDGPRAVGLKLKESLKSGVRIKIDVSHYELDKIVVAVTSDNVLKVYIIGDEKKMLHVLQLSQNPPLQSLLCSIVDGTSLYIRERSKEAMALEFSGAGDKFLPVIKTDETSLKFTAVIHIPEEITFDDVIVKTVDESLVIKGQQGTSSQSPSGTSIRVLMALPEGADNRSVVARMIDFNQLVIEGLLGLASRRMTCNF